MVKKVYLVFLFSLALIQIQAQRLSAGVHLGTDLSQTFDYNSKFIFPEYSYQVYYTVMEDKTSRSQALSGFQAGYYLQLDYKQWYLGSELNFAVHNYTSDLLFAQYNDWSILGDQGWVQINVKQTALEIPMFIGYKLLKRNFNVSLFGGATYNCFLDSNEDGYLNINSDVMVQAFMGFYELYGIVYNDKPYWRLLTGIGFHYKNHGLSIRYEHRINNEINKLPVTHYQITINWNWIINFQKMKKGHYIYTED